MWHWKPIPCSDILTVSISPPFLTMMPIGRCASLELAWKVNWPQLSPPILKSVSSSPGTPRRLVWVKLGHGKVVSFRVGTMGKSMRNEQIHRSSPVRPAHGSAAGSSHAAGASVATSGKSAISLDKRAACGGCSDNKFWQTAIL